MFIKIQSTILLVSLIFAGLCSGQNTLMLQQKTFYDKGTTGPVASHTILIPEGWKAEGKAFWANAKYFNIVPSQDIKLTSPEGYGVHVGPVMNFSDFNMSVVAIQEGRTKMAELSADNGRAVLYRPTTLKGWSELYKNKIFPTMEGRSNLKLTDVFFVPELKAVIHQQMEPVRKNIDEMNATLRSMNVSQNSDCEAIAIRFKYREGGFAKEAINIFGMTTVYTKNYLGTRVDWNVNVDVLLSAPDGKLESALPKLVAIASSTREVPNWSRLKAQHLATMHGIAIKGFADRSRIIADTFREVSRIQNETYRNTSRASDRMHQKYINSLREVETYSQGNYQYELPSGYDHVFGDGNGNFILTDNALFNPNVDLNSAATWTGLNPNR